MVIFLLDLVLLQKVTVIFLMENHLKKQENH